MERFDDLVQWTFEMDCPACQQTFECQATVFPKDSGVLLSTDEFETHVDNCPKFRAEYQKLMGWN